MTTVTSTPHSAPVDQPTASLLDLIAQARRDDRDEVEQAIRHSAADHAGRVDMNDVRARLYTDTGCIVHPNAIGATVNALARAGVLVHEGWSITSGSTSGNNGRAQKCYRLTDGAS